MFYKAYKTKKDLILKVINTRTAYTTLVNIYAPNTGVPKYIKQTVTDTMGETDDNTIIVGNFNTYLHQWTDQPDRKSTGNSCLK